MVTNDPTSVQTYSGVTTINVAPLGADRIDPQDQLDLRASKSFKLNGAINTVPQYLSPVSILAPRIARFNLAIRF